MVFQYQLLNIGYLFTGIAAVQTRAVPRNGVEADTANIADGRTSHSTAHDRPLSFTSGCLYIFAVADTALCRAGRFLSVAASRRLRSRSGAESEAVISSDPTAHDMTNCVLPGWPEPLMRYATGRWEPSVGAEPRSRIADKTTCRKPKWRVTGSSGDRHSHVTRLYDSWCTMRNAHDACTGTQ